MPIFDSILIFILGLCVGSFLNVVIDRLPAGKSIVYGRSHCDHCKHALSWYDLFPVVSFLFLAAKCRYCDKKISWQYPAVELVTGILSIFVFWFLSPNYPALPTGRQSSITNHQLPIFYDLLIIYCLIIIFFTDLKYRIIPDQVLAVMTIAAGIFLFFFTPTGLMDHLSAAGIFFLIFLLLVVITRGRGMGLGDVKYAAVSGFILGVNFSIIAFYLSFLTGAFISLILVIAGKKKLKSTIPFGPFLVGGTAVSLFYGQGLWEIFKKIIGI